jgi:hypothetical protein
MRAGLARPKLLKSAISFAIIVARQNRDTCGLKIIDSNILCI